METLIEQGFNDKCYKITYKLVNYKILLVLINEIIIHVPCKVMLFSIFHFVIFCLFLEGGLLK